MQDDACAHRKKVLFVYTFIVNLIVQIIQVRLLYGRETEWAGWSSDALPYMRTVPGRNHRAGYSDSLRDGRFGDRIPLGARFSTRIQTGPEAHPASYTMGTGSLLGMKRPGPGVDHPSLSSAEIKERVVSLLLLWAFVTCSRVNFNFYPAGIAVRT